jgi:hypothetical protein
VQAEPQLPERKAPKVISPSDPASASTAKANKRVQFGYGLNYRIDVELPKQTDSQVPAALVAGFFDSIGHGRNESELCPYRFLAQAQPQERTSLPHCGQLSDLRAAY